MLRRAATSLLWVLFLASASAGAQEQEEEDEDEDDLFAPKIEQNEEASQRVRSHSLHPRFVLRDVEGTPVIESGQPLSQAESCGACHDTAFIARHSAHARAGQEQSSTSMRAWETSTGWFGGWDPRTYDLAEADQSERWAKTYGKKHVGGGPVEALGVELDCFLCHLENPAMEARARELAAGRFEWASTATLLNTALVSQDLSGLHWQSEAFPSGEFPADTLTISRPNSDRCSSCHQQSYQQKEPLGEIVGDSLYTGIIYSGQRIDSSGLNISKKSDLNRSWDVHAERLVECADCHHSQNNPSHEGNAIGPRPSHLRFDPRRSSTSAYLLRPSHELAQGSYSTQQGKPKTTLRRCVSCHDPSAGHEQLPSKSRHFETVACESCHIPETHLSAISHLDWTALTSEGRPLRSYRGGEGDPNDVHKLSTGYKPALLQRADGDGNLRYAPYNLITYSYWVSGTPKRPIAKEVLERVFANTDALLSTFDANKDHQISEEELRLDTDKKLLLITQLLKSQGEAAPQVRNEIEALALHHGIAEGRSVLRDCSQCHGAESRLLATIPVADYLPGNTPPEWIHRASIESVGEVLPSQSTAWIYHPKRKNRDLSQHYVFGTDALAWLDWLGLGALLLVLVGAGAHGLARYIKQGRHTAPLKDQGSSPTAVGSVGEVSSVTHSEEEK